MDYPIQSPGQLATHLRALRKKRGLSQVELGAVIGVGQARIARIERDPTAISVDQFLGLLGALGVQMVLRPTGARDAADPAQARSLAAPPDATAGKRRASEEPW